MSTVTVSIDGIILNCDESILPLNIGNGYNVKKVYIDDFPYKNRITDAQNNLNIEYIRSRQEDSNGEYFYCLSKTDSYEIDAPTIRPGIALNQDDIMCNNQLENYKNQETAYLFSYFSLLHIFKHGNIATKEVFYKHKHTTLGFENTQTHKIINYSYNISDLRQYTLTADEIIDLNRFTLEFLGSPLDIIKKCVDEFVWGLAQIDIPTAFEQYTTSLEMILLEAGQQGKKECLAKRIALLLAHNDTEIQDIYEQVKVFYRYRSESLHEGNGENITLPELYEMEEITRKVIKKFLYLSKSELIENPLKEWDEIKSNEICKLKNAVQAKISCGVLS